MIDVSEDVFAWADGEPNFGWGLIPSASQGGEFQSFEHPDELGRPQLILLGPDGSDLRAVEETPSANMKPGDVNADGEFNISDPVRQLNYLFTGAEISPCFIVGGADPADPNSLTLTEAGRAALDFNGDGRSDITDAVSALNFLFRGGGAPAPVLGVDCVDVPGTCDSTCR